MWNLGLLKQHEATHSGYSKTLRLLEGLSAQLTLYGPRLSVRS